MKSTRCRPTRRFSSLHLYDRAFLNGAALRAVGYTKDTPDPPGGEIQRDKRGNPTGILIAKPNAYILYSTLVQRAKAFAGISAQLHPASSSGN